MYKETNGMSPDETHYHLRYTTQFLVDPVHSVFNDSESALFWGPKIREQTPTEIKNRDSFVEFKKEIRKWKPINCPCRMCKTFTANVGFI